MDRVVELQAIGRTLQGVEESISRHSQFNRDLPDLECDRRAQVLETRRSQLQEASKKLSGLPNIGDGDVVTRADHVVAEAVLKDMLLNPDVTLRGLSTRSGWNRHYGYGRLNGLHTRVPGTQVDLVEYRTVGGPAYYDVLLRR